MKKRIPALCLALCLVLLSFAACGAKSNGNIGYYDSASSTAAYYENEAYEEPADYWDGYQPMEGVVSGGDLEMLETGSADAPAQKLIYSADARLETKEIQPALDYLYDRIRAYSCIIEEERTYNIDSAAVKDESYYFSGGTPEAQLTVRVPSDRYDSFIADLKAKPEVLYAQNISSSVENLTRSYYDMQSRVEALRAEEKWLLEFMEEAENVSEMLEIKDRLTEVQYQIEQYTSEMRVIDYDADYSTVSIDLVQVQSYTESKTANFGERLAGYFEGSGQAFLDAMESILEILIYLLPFLLLAGVIAFVVVRIVRANGKRAAKKRQPFPPAPPQNPVPPGGNDGKAP